MPATTIAFDLGSTKIDICRMTKAGEILSHDRVRTADLAPGSPEFLPRAFELFATHVADQDDKIGLSWNAPVHRGRLSQSSLLGGRVDVDLGAMLRERFGRDVQVESDVHAMALGEYRFGAGATAAPLLLVNLGSGAGLAYHDGTLMRGHLGGAGLVCNETRCVPQIGEILTLDYLLSGRGVSLLHERLSGRSVPAAEVARQAEDRQADAVRAFGIFAEHFGTYLVTLCRIFNPRTIVIAGSVGLAAPFYLDRALAILAEQVEPACRPDSVRVTTLEAPACRGLA